MQMRHEETEACPDGGTDDNVARKVTASKDAADANDARARESRGEDDPTEGGSPEPMKRARGCDRRGRRVRDVTAE